MPPGVAVGVKVTPGPGVAMGGKDAGKPSRWGTLSLRGRGAGRQRNRWAILVLVAILVVAASIRIRLLDVPLERDEGEYAYAAQLLLQGVVPYARIYSMKMPGIYGVYAVIEAVFGQTRTGIHLGLLVVNLCTAVLVFLLGLRLLGPLGGLTAAAAFALLSVGRPVQGIFANAEHFVLLPALAGILLLLRAGPERWRGGTLFAGGLLLGIAFLVKQHGLAFAAFAGLYVLASEGGRRPLRAAVLVRRIGVYLAGVFVPFGLTCLALYIAGVFHRFWFWTFVYAGKYVATLPLGDGMERLGVRLAQIAGPSLAVWILAGIGLTAPLWSRAVRRHGWFLMGFALFSFLAVCPGLYFRRHYFVLFLPAVGLLAGAAAGGLEEALCRLRSPRLGRAIAISVVALAILSAGLKQEEFLFRLDPVGASRATYGLNPFPESIEIARFIRERTTDRDLIAVIGSEPEIYFYARRRAATGHVYMYPLVEVQPFAAGMQDEMIREIESAGPSYVVLVNVQASWLVRPGAERRVMDWASRYLDRFYQVVGAVDIVSTRETVYKWLEEAEAYWPRSGNWVAVFQRKGP